MSKTTASARISRCSFASPSCQAYCPRSAGLRLAERSLLAPPLLRRDATRSVEVAIADSASPWVVERGPRPSILVPDGLGWDVTEGMTMGDTQRTYPQGVSCWIDTEQGAPAPAAAFYGGLFGWTFDNAMPADAPGVYLIAQLDGLDVAAIRSGATGSVTAWNTYFTIDDVDAFVPEVVRAGGLVLSGPDDAGPAAAPQPAATRRARSSASGAGDLPTAKEFYERLFHWKYLDLGESVEAMTAVDGYGRHLQSTVDPGIYERQAGAPEGFADVIGTVQSTTGSEQPHWEVVISVASRVESVERAQELGATLLSTEDTPWTDLARIEDPQGATLALSEFREPGDS
ncbi:VOC family protein [Herbiconiux sp. 11R-BC]|uniref:VOC family protein n=1 Tax=Herbiconiux sp. 11R-BC TaxID=3111637 RepID=UPI003C05D2BB